MNSNKFMLPYYISTLQFQYISIYECSYWLHFINDVNVQFSSWSLLWFKNDTINII